MFDVGFSEMMVIAIVALVVLGPEKLPKIARTVGKFYGSMQRYMSGFKADIEREVALDNMRKATAEAQQKLLELQSQVKVLSGEIPELAARAQEGEGYSLNADSLTPEHAAQTTPEPVPSHIVLAETSVKEDEVLWKKKA
ncbi:MAG: twin-arginine translocase subunit TatB [Methylobacillus glycogenes]|nr:twin-arginine translocase subunit TatB [Methylobacillus glycogenes]